MPEQQDKEGANRPMEGSSPASSDIRRGLGPRHIVAGVGLILLGAWVFWWAASFSTMPPRMLLADSSWLPAWRFLGLDLMHNHLGARAWIGGSNPFLHFFGDDRALYTYPPIVLPMFAWAALVPDPRTATALWAAAIAGIALLALWQVRAYRKAMGTDAIPYAAMAAMVLWSAPVVFAIERGNCDALVLLFMVLAAMAMVGPRAGRLSHEFLAGLCLALAISVKLYPFVVVAALIALRRYRILAMLAICMLALVLLPFEYWRQFIDVLKSQQASQVGVIAELFDWLRGDLSLLHSATPVYRSADWVYIGSLHSPGNWWPPLWLRLGLPSIAAWPFALVQLVTVVPALLYGCWMVFRQYQASRMTLPVLLWIMTVATFAMPRSWDYNLIFLPILFVALWDRRDGWPLHLALLSLLPWLIPFGPVSQDWALTRDVLKLLGLYLATFMLARQLRRLAAAGEGQKTSTIAPGVSPEVSEQTRSPG